MNSIKARDFFSAYFEGSLEPGLKQAFERALRTDAIVQAEYTQFERVMAQLDTLHDEAVNPPADLHERISARLDRSIYEAERQKPKSIFMSWRSLAYGGLAAALILGAVLSLNVSDDPARTSGFVPPISRGSETVAPPSLLATPTGLNLQYRSLKEGIVYVKAGIEGRVVQQIAISADQSIDSPLNNRSQEAALLQIVFPHGERPLLVALPGQARSEVRDGEGTIADLAVALAGVYGAPVEVRVQDPGKRTNWRLEAEDAVDAISSVVGPSGITLERQASGLLVLTD